MQGIKKIQKHNPQLAQKIKENGGFISLDDIAALMEVDRLLKVLVRCNKGRFFCPVQDAEHFMGIIAEHAKLKSQQTNKSELIVGDYVRDISLPK